MPKLTVKWRQGPGGRDVQGLTVTFDERQKHKFRTRLDNGLEVVVALPRGEVLAPGDLLASDDGLLVEVRAAAERLSLVQCRDTLELARLCYLLGSLGHPVQIDGLRLFYPQESAVDHMVRRMDCDILPVTSAFEPEGRGGCAPGK